MARRLLDYAPVTGRTCGKAAFRSRALPGGDRISDNTAANLILRQIGGPARRDRLCAPASATNVTRLDRMSRR